MAVVKDRRPAMESAAILLGKAEAYLGAAVKAMERAKCDQAEIDEHQAIHDQLTTNRRAVERRLV